MEAKAAKPKTQKKTLQDLLLIKMQALYDVETEITKALPKMTEAATDPELKEAFRNHLKETEAHVARLEQAFTLLNEKPKKLKVEAIRGLVEDGKWVIKQKMGSEATDATLVGAASYVEHYEMAGYLAAKRWANEMGNGQLTALFQETLREEERADEKLKTLAQESLDARVDALA